MFTNYFKMAYRSLLKNKLASSINIVGLAIAISTSLLVFLFIEEKFGRDDFHENAERIFLIEHTIDGDEGPEIWGTSPTPLGPAIKADFPRIQRAVRVSEAQATIRHKTSVFNEDIQFVDQEFLRMFTFPLKYGDPASLSDRNAVILSYDIAKKYFGEGDPIETRETLEIALDEEHSETFVVMGVAEKFPENASFGFNMLLAYDKQLALGKSDFTDWNDMAAWTLIEVDRPESIANIQSGMGRYVELQNAASGARSERKISGFILEPLLRLSLDAHNVRQPFANGSEPLILILIGLIGLSLLAIACFNYMNIATAAASKRLKEIGIRKVIGGNKAQLVKQFLAENLLLCFIALVAGILLAEFFLLPGANNLFGNEEGGSLLEVIGVPSVWLFLVGTLLLTGLGAGAYPAFYVASFQPVAILQRKLHSQKSGGRGNLFTRSLLTLQFIFTFLLIVLVVVFIQNEKHQRNRDWGYAKEQAIIIPVDGHRQFALLKNEIRGNPNIVDMAGTAHHVGRSVTRGLVEDFTTTPATQVAVERLDVGPNYIETLGIRLKSGRTFSLDLSTDADESIIVNEAFVARIGWEKPIGKNVVYDSSRYSVIGVVEDFVNTSLVKKPRPVILRLASEEDFNYLVVRVQAGAAFNTHDYLEGVWGNLVSDAPYPGFFQEDVFAELFRSMDIVNTIFTFISSMALIIACMGLFGLVTLNLTKRLKEIGIRKVLGASLLHVMRVINREFVRLLIVAVLLALPLSYFLMRMLVNSLFPSQGVLGFSPFAVASVLIFATAFLTLSTQIYKATATNPVDVLRNE